MNQTQSFQRSIALARGGKSFIAKGGVTIFVNLVSADAYTVMKAGEGRTIEALDCGFNDLRQVLEIVFSNSASSINVKWDWRSATAQEINFISDDLVTEKIFPEAPHSATQEPVESISSNGPREWIYILANSSMSGVLKIGRTDRTPSERSDELSSATGVPSPFIIIWEEETGDSEAAEAEIHRLLSDRRVNKGREFFRIDTKSAIAIVLRVCASFPAASAKILSKSSVDFDREDELIMLSLQVVQQCGSIEPRIIRMKFGASFDEGRCVFEKLQMMGAIEPSGKRLTGYWASEIRKSLGEIK